MHTRINLFFQPRRLQSYLKTQGYTPIGLLAYLTPRNHLTSGYSGVFEGELSKISRHSLGSLHVLACYHSFQLILVRAVVDACHQDWGSCGCMSSGLRQLLCRPGWPHFFIWSYIHVCSCYAIIKVCGFRVITAT